MKNKCKVIMAVFTAIMAVTANADYVLSNLYGDKDGFGIAGMDAVPADGTVIYNRGLVQDASDPVFMDDWGYEHSGGDFGSPITYSHNFASLPAPVVSATLTIQHAGMGDDRGPWDVAINGVSVGQISTGRAEGDSSSLEMFVLDSVSMIGAENMITLTYGDTQNEGYAINFSELSVTVIPEPMSASLIIALFPLMVVRRHLRCREHGSKSLYMQLNKLFRYFYLGARA